jgi:hypothetical protein
VSTEWSLWGEDAVVSVQLDLDMVEEDMILFAQCVCSAKLCLSGGLRFEAKERLASADQLISLIREVAS